MHLMRRLLVCLALTLAPVAPVAPYAPVAPVAPDPPDLPPTIRAYLERAGFTERDYQLLAAGHAAARIIDTSEHDQLGVVAVIRVNASPARFAAAYRDIVSFESGKGVLGKGVLAMGLVSTPPALADFASLVLPSSDLDDLKGCRIGDCAINLSSYRDCEPARQRHQLVRPGCAGVRARVRPADAGELRRRVSAAG